MATRKLRPIEKQMNNVLDELYMMAKDDESIVPKNAWDFRRICYDLAVGSKWDKKVERPFAVNASTTLMNRAHEIAVGMLEDPSTILDLYNESRGYRGEPKVEPLLP